VREKEEGGGERKKEKDKGKERKHSIERGGDLRAEAGN